MFIAVNNIARQQEINPIAIGFKQRVLESMKKQIRKKLVTNVEQNTKSNSMTTIKIIGRFTITQTGPWFQVWHKDYSTIRCTCQSIEECEYFIYHSTYRP